MNVLAGDIGGTKTILAIYSWIDRPKKIHEKYYASSQWISFDSILKDFVKNVPKNISWPEYGCIGAAGRASNLSFKLTNLNWLLEQSKLCEICNLKTLELINDFSVLIYGISYFQETQYEVIQGSKRNLLSNNFNFLGMIGAGTGLGMARGIIKSKEVISLPSEGGHQEFAARSEQEWLFSEWLKKDLKVKRLSIERVVSGTGLGHIARWMLSKDDAKNHKLQKLLSKSKNKSERDFDFPALVSNFALNGDPIMSEALQLWLKAYGSAAGDFALHELCSSGLWIAGGSSAKNLNGIRSSGFLNAFKNKGRFQEYLSKIPIMVLIDKEAGLFSSACRARIIAESNGRLS